MDDFTLADDFEPVAKDDFEPVGVKDDFTPEKNLGTVFKSVLDTTKKIVTAKAPQGVEEAAGNVDRILTDALHQVPTFAKGVVKAVPEQLGQLVSLLPKIKVFPETPMQKASREAGQASYGAYPNNPNPQAGPERISPLGKTTAFSPEMIDQFNQNKKMEQWNSDPNNRAMSFIKFFSGPVFPLATALEYLNKTQEGGISPKNAAEQSGVDVGTMLTGHLLGSVIHVGNIKTGDILAWKPPEGVHSALKDIPEGTTPEDIINIWNDAYGKSMERNPELYRVLSRLSDEDKAVLLKKAIKERIENPTEVKPSTEEPITPEEVDTNALREKLMRNNSSMGAQYAEPVPTTALEKFSAQEELRTPKGSPEYETLKTDIEKNGIQEPIVIGYDAQTKSAEIVEGNHRLAIAKELGIKDVPVVVQNTGVLRGGVPIKGVEGEVPFNIKPSEAGITLQGGIPGAKEFIDQDVVPFAQQHVKVPIENLVSKVTKFIAPGYGASPKALNRYFEMKGERDLEMAKSSLVFDQYAKAFDKLPEPQQIDFIDRFKRGENQATPELDNVVKIIQKFENASYSLKKEFAENLTYKENHIRALWKVIPGAVEKKGFTGNYRKPLAGSKGSLKKSTLTDLTEGIERGGVPYTTNPIKMMLMGYADDMKFVTAKKVMSNAKTDGMIQFIRVGKSAPDGWVRINDNLAKIVFPSKSKEGMIQAGEYWAQPDFGRLINNFVSKDYLRDDPTLNSLIQLKNLTTAIELSFSPFHAVFESIDAMSAQVAIGLMKTTNEGLFRLIAPKSILEAKQATKQLVSGLTDIFLSPTAPVSFAREGGNFIRYLKTQQDFIDLVGGEKFLRKYPNAKELVNDLFLVAGGQLKMHEDYRISSYHTLMDAIDKNNIIGAGLRLFPALNEFAMGPLFNVYIPRLKIGIWLKEYSQQLSERADDIASGSVKREELARDTWTRVENRLGEMNFDNLAWNRTFKTSLQLLFRSVTWKLGSLRFFAGAPLGQGKALTDWFEKMPPEGYPEGHEDFPPIKGFRLTTNRPRLNPSMAGVLSILMVSSVLSQIVNHMLHPNVPEEEKTIQDHLFIWTGDYDRNGNKIYMMPPTYLKDIAGLKANPKNYIMSSMSGIMSRLRDVIRNKDYFGDYVYNPHDPLTNQLLQGMAYVLFTKPFIVQNLQKLQSETNNPVTKILPLLGMTKAPKELTETKFQLELGQAFNEQLGSRPRTPEEKKTYQQKQIIKQKIRTGNFTPSELVSAMQDKIIPSTGSDFLKFIKTTKMSPVSVMWKGLGDEEKARIIPFIKEERDMEAVFKVEMAEATGKSKNSKGIMFLIGHMDDNQKQMLKDIISRGVK